MTPAAPSGARPGVTGGSWVEHEIELCGGRVRYRQSGQGTPAIVLHRDNGMPESEQFFDLLTEHHEVFVPLLPGYHGGHPEDWSWLANTRDLAVVLQALVANLDIDAGQITLIGLGFGGWLAAEMATMSQRRLSNLVLVNPMGVRPESGYIYDQFLVNSETYCRQGFADQSRFEQIYGAKPDYEQLEAWETDREMTSRIGWKPYMYNASLPQLLRGVETSTLIVASEADEIVPMECAQIYESALPSSRLERLSGVGHAADLEAPRELADLINAFSK